MRYRLMLISLFVLIMTTTQVWPHGGGVDKQGCHTNGRTGEHHCHTANSNKSQPANNNTIVEIPASNSSSFVGGNNKLTIAIQKELVRLGYFPGNVMGYRDPKTIMAIKFFQQDIELEPTGEINQELLRILRGYER